MRRALLLSFVLWSAGAAAQIPVLHVSPDSLVIVLESRNPAAPRQIRIRNLGSGTLRWTARPAVPWIRVSPSAGSGPAVLSVEIDGARLTPGRHESRVAIDAGDADDSPVSVTVTVEVAAASAQDPPARPARQAAPAAGQTAAAQQATRPDASASRAGAASSLPGPDTSGRLRFSRQTLPPAMRSLPYVQAIPIAGGTPPYAVRLVEGRLPAGLALAQGSIAGTARVQGYYPFTVAVTDESTPPVTITRPLAIRVIILQADTALVVSPPVISLRLPGRTRNGRAPMAVASGRQRLEWSAGADVPWLLVAPASGVSPATLEIIALADRLSPGTHAGTVTVTMEGAPNSPASVPVQVTVPR